MSLIPIDKFDFISQTIAEALQKKFANKEPVRPLDVARTILRLSGVYLEQDGTMTRDGAKAGILYYANFTNDSFEIIYKIKEFEGFMATKIKIVDDSTRTSCNHFETLVKNT